MIFSVCTDRCTNKGIVFVESIDCEWRFWAGSRKFVLRISTSFRLAIISGKNHSSNQQLRKLGWDWSCSAFREILFGRSGGTKRWRFKFEADSFCATRAGGIVAEASIFYEQKTWSKSFFFSRGSREWRCFENNISDERLHSVHHQYSGGNVHYDSAVQWRYTGNKLWPQLFDRPRHFRLRYAAHK